MAKKKVSKKASNLDARKAGLVGKEVAKLLNAAKKESDKLLAEFGYEVDVKAEFMLIQNNK